MTNIKFKIFELLWKHKICIIYQNKKTRDYELKLQYSKICQYPYLFKCLIYDLKKVIKDLELNALLVTNHKTTAVASVISYETDLPLFHSLYEVKDLDFFEIKLSITKSNQKNNCIAVFDLRTHTNITDNSHNIITLFHVYELLDYGNKHNYIDDLQWDLCQMNYYKKIPFEQRDNFKKNITNRSLPITKCYNLLFKKKKNLILDCSGLNAVDTLTTISIYAKYIFMVIVDSDCFLTFTKKHRECFQKYSQEESLLIYDRLRIEHFNKQQLEQIINKKIGKVAWLHGFYLYTFNTTIVDFFKDQYPTIGIFFESRDLENNKDDYVNLQRNIIQTVGLTLQNNRQEHHIDSRIFYNKSITNIDTHLSNKSLTQYILFNNYDFITLHNSIINKYSHQDLVSISNKSWSLFKNKF